MTSQIAYLALSVLMLGVFSNGVAGTVTVRCGNCVCGYTDWQHNSGPKFLVAGFCDDNTTVLDVRSQNISSVSSGRLSKTNDDTTELILSNNIVQHLPEFHWSIGKLRILKVDHNKLWILNPRALDNLRKLERLDMSSNNLTSLYANTFDHCRNLTELYLDRNSIVHIANQIFAFNTKLRRLTLDNNHIVRLPNDTFDPLKNLIFLTLDNNRMDRLPQNVFHALHNLQHLTFNNNHLTSLANDTFSLLKKLTFLDISYNLLTELDDILFRGPSKLEILYVTDNQLTSLPQAVFWLNMKLSMLSLQRNRIASLPMFIFYNLRNVEVYLDGNNISSLSSFGHRPVLWHATVLSLSDNPLTTLPVTIFSRNLLLRQLYLDDLPLESIDPDLFKDLLALERLSLRNSNLKKLPEKIFEPLQNLKKLDLRGNDDLRRYSPAMLRNNHQLTNAGLKVSPLTFTLDSFWTKHGIPFTSGWYYGLRLDFETMLNIISFSELVQSRCGADGPLLILPGRSISFACNCTRGKVFNGRQCIAQETAICSPAPFPGRDTCDVYPTCAANRTIRTNGQSAEQCTCPPNTVLVRNPCIQGQGGQICATRDRQQCTTKPACSGRTTHICVCPSHAATMSCLPHGSCSTHHLRQPYPRTFDYHRVLSNGQHHEGGCRNGVGKIDFTCNNGTITVVEQCSCDMRRLQQTYPSALKGIAALKHEESVVKSCPNSISTGGRVSFTCNNSRITVESQNCSCSTANVVSSHPSVFHGIQTMKYGQSISIACPGTAGGDIVFQCVEGVMKTVKNCSCSTLHVRTAFQQVFTANSVPVTGLINNQSIRGECPSGGTIAFTCDNGNITIANKCQRLKCGGYDLSYTTATSVDQLVAQHTCTLFGATLPKFISARDHCSSKIVKSMATPVWLAKSGMAETLPGYVRGGPQGLETFRPHSQLRALPHEPIRFFCQHFHKRHQCGAKDYYLVPARTVHGTFIMHTYRQASDECQQRGLVLPDHASERSCTQAFLRKLASERRGAAWLRSLPTRGAHWATNIRQEFMFPGPRPLPLTICTTRY